MADKKNEIIEAEYREVHTGCTLPEITAQIIYITQNMKRTLLTGAIEIGKRFEMAKGLVERGKWGEYCEQYTGYKQSMAENYIKVYKEYGSEQQSLFGDFTNSQSIGSLGITKLIELIAVPADEREKFVEDNNVTEDTTVKELRKLIRQKDDELTAAENKKADAEKKLADSIENSDKVIADKQATIDRLKKELNARNAEAPITPTDEFEKMMAEAEEKAKKTLKKEIDRLQEERDKAEKDRGTAQDKLNKLLADNKELQDKVSEAESRSEAMQAEIDRLKKESMLGANENMVRLNMMFENAQNAIIDVASALDTIESQEQSGKLRGAVLKTLTDLIEERINIREAEVTEDEQTD